jgi:sulfite reductase alpha subunit-like flavoprotein
MSVSASITETVETPELDFMLTYVPSTGGRVSSAKKLEDSKINSSTKYYFPNHHAEVRVAVNRELRTPKDGGSTKHIELDLQGSGLTVSRRGRAGLFCGFMQEGLSR